jgi:hypothetical protein
VVKPGRDFSPRDAQRLLSLPGYRKAVMAGGPDRTPGRIVIRKVNLRGVETLVHDAWDVRPVLLKKGPPVLLKMGVSEDEAFKAAADLASDVLHVTAGLDLSAAFGRTR